jgi:MFS family permease
MILAVVVLVLTIREKKVAAQVAAESQAWEESKGKTEETRSDGPTAVYTKLSGEVKRSLTFILLSIFFWFAAYNAVTTAFSRYVRVVWGLEGGGFANCLMVATVAAILSYVPIGAVAAKIGRKKSIQIGLILMFVCYLSAALLPDYSGVLNIFFALIGIGWAAISVNSLPMVVEMCSAGDVGKYTGLYYTFSMSAQIFTPIFSGFLLQHISYRTLFPYACVFTALAMLTMTQVRHGDSRPEKKEKILENFDVDD